ncbi:hypothetical protein FRACA_600013 [Frankia canadensis]|uniref:Uncharacterized protein n=1 Tax=Frankia canadensis TaxID=1836972 RepID=A0A2I2KZK4_9ACTN|nr:hypothetical protein FRACA_600013 [Frankia canadensis]SOU58392.1 hypothetical protein FRACA_600013 [Frankia canadensis]
MPTSPLPVLPARPLSGSRRGRGTAMEVRTFADREELMPSHPRERNRLVSCDWAPFVIPSQDGRNDSRRSLRVGGQPPHSRRVRPVRGSMRSRCP